MDNTTRTQDLRKIHGTARKLGMGEFQRRALQYDVTGRESCLEMTATERAVVIAELTKPAPKPARTASKWTPVHAPKYAADDTSDAAMAELLGL